MGISPELVSKLRELGLTEYEARVYLTLLERGPLKPSEIAIKSGVPRTKVYEAVRSLERKGLAKTYGRPRVCVALDAEEALRAVIEEEEKRLSGLKEVLNKLKEIRAKRLGIYGETEGRYYIIGGSAASSKLKQLALSAKRSFHALVDSWGLDLLAKNKYELGLLPLNGIDVRVVVGGEDAETLETLDLPFAVRVGLFKTSNSLFVVDKRTSFLLDSNVGIGILLDVPQIAELIDSLILFEKWESSYPMQKYLELAKSGLPDLPAILANGFVLADALREAVTDVMTEEQISEVSRRVYSKLSEILPELPGMPIEASISAWTAILRTVLPGGMVRYEPYTKMLTIEYRGGSRMPPTVWFFALLGYFNSKGVKPVMLHVDGKDDRMILQMKLPVKQQVLDENLNLLSIDV